MKATAKNNEVINKIDEEVIANVEYVAVYDAEDVTAGAVREEVKKAEKKAAKFEMREALAARRNDVIAKYIKLTSEDFFNGITLKAFMVEVMNVMQMNAPKSQKRFDDLFDSILGRIYFKNSTICGGSTIDDKVREMYRGTAMMALV